jgi:hypothetical protein
VLPGNTGIPFGQVSLLRRKRRGTFSRRANSLRLRRQGFQRKADRR